MHRTKGTNMRLQLTLAIILASAASWYLAVTLGHAIARLVTHL